MVGSMRGASRFSLLAAAVFVGVLAGCGSAPASAPSPVLGKAIKVGLLDQAGNTVSVPVQGARSTVLDFWSPTCEPCRKSVPALVAKLPEIEARGGKVLLVGVLSEDESPLDARGALESWGVRYPFLVDRGEVIQKKAAVMELPATLILDAEGVVHWVAPTGASATDIVKALP
jgi:hypothetical protein